MKIVKFCIFAAIGFAASVACGKSYNIDLSASVADKAIRAQSRPTERQGGGEVLRSFDLDAGAADVGRVEEGDELIFTLFDDVEITLKLVEETPSALGGDIFLAEASGYEGVKNAVVMRTSDGLTIDVQDYLNDKTYKVISSPDGVRVKEIKNCEEGGCVSCEAQARGEFLDDNVEAPEVFIEKEETLAFAEKDDDEEQFVDILVAYDTNAAKYAFSEGGLTNFAQVAVAKINTALANTGLSQYFRYRLVGVTTLAVSTNEVMGAINAINQNDWGWDKVKTERKKYGADIATTFVVTELNDATTGVANGLRNLKSQTPFNVCTIRTVATGYTMVHECGHNMGAGHGHEEGGQLFEYSKGYYLYGNDSKPYSTVMCYTFNHPEGRSTRIPYFSSPNYQYKGAATGSADRDNTRTIEQSWPYVVKWCEQVVPITYKVVFDIGTHGVRTGGGELEQTVERGKAAIAPVVAAHSGWEFLGWDTQFDNIKSNLKIKAIWQSTGPSFFIENGVLTKVELNEYPNVKVPDDVVAIGPEALKGCEEMLSVYLPDGIASIGEGAFYGCKGLTSITIPRELTRLGNNAFWNCNSLKEVHVSSLDQWCTLEFGNNFSNPLYYGQSLYVHGELIADLAVSVGIKNIGDYAFYGCRTLKSVTIPGSVTNIGASAFAFCRDVKEVSLDNGVKEIGAMAFQGCNAMERLYIPESLTSVGSSAFQYCAKLETVYTPSLAAWFEIYFANQFSNPLYYAQEFCVGDELVEEITVPDSVEEIGSYVFAGYKNLKSVAIGDGVKLIAGNAFGGCENLGSVTISPDSTIEIEEGAFAGCASLEEVYIPISATCADGAFPAASTVSYYKTTLTVTFDANGGTVALKNKTVEYSTVYGELPVPVREGYRFEGWRLGDNVIEAQDIVNELEDHTLVAVWTAIEYEIRFHANDGTGDVLVQTFTYEDEVVLQANDFELEEAEFLGWSLSPVGKVAYADGAKIPQFVTLLNNGAINLYAVWLIENRYVSVDTSYVKAQEANGAIYDENGDLAGVAALKIGKKDKKNKVKISGSITTLNGKKISAKAISLDLPKGDGVSVATLAFKQPIGNMTLEIDSEGTVKLYGGFGELEIAYIGGNWTKRNAKVYVDFGELPQTVQKQLLPNGEAITPKGGKWQFAGAATVKLVKDKTTGKTNLQIDSSKDKTNLSALKLGYTPKTGAFNGSFKIYSIEAGKLKKYSAKVTGLVVDGEGAGIAVLPKPISKTARVIVTTAIR